MLAARCLDWYVAFAAARAGKKADLLANFSVAGVFVGYVDIKNIA